LGKRSGSSTGFGAEVGAEIFGAAVVLEVGFGGEIILDCDNSRSVSGETATCRTPRDLNRRVEQLAVGVGHGTIVTRSGAAAREIYGVHDRI
jgi:hypothetical protein